jgi:hypothetical protein
MKGWHVEPFACSLETQFGDFDACLSASATNFLQLKYACRFWQQTIVGPP